jgi:hypothetical protein
MKVKGLADALKKARETASQAGSAMSGEIASAAAFKVPRGVSVAVKDTAKGVSVSYKSDSLPKPVFDKFVAARRKQFAKIANDSVSKKITGDLK